MGTISLSLPSDGSTIDAADVNGPLNAIVAEFNGNIDNTNIKAAAAIDGSKLASAGITATQLATGAVTFDKAAIGFLVGISIGSSSSSSTGTTIIPLDDTIPQNTEGDEYLTLSITPRGATHLLEIDVTIFLANSAAAYNMIAALFQDTIANALATSISYGAVAGAANSLRIHHSMVAGTTSAITFKVRAGANTAGTTTVNGIAGNRFFGTTTKSTIALREYKV